MSNPRNTLADFQSHSALHILIMTDGIKTANLLRDDPSAFLDNTDDPEQLFDLQTVQATDDPSVKGRYIVVLDGRRNSNYSIKSVNWETVFNPASGDMKTYSQMEMDGDMVIEEPFGVELLEVLTKGASALDVVPAGVVYMLKTFFIGFDGNGQQQIIDDIRPFTFTITDMKAEMQAMGTVYNFNVIGTTNGISKLPQISNIAEGIKASIEVGQPLSKAVIILQDKINRRYHEYKKTMLETLQEEINKNDDIVGRAADLVSERYSDVRYVITLDDDYSEPQYIIGTNEGDTTFQTDDKIAIAFDTDATVEDCIHTLLKTCEEVERESTVKEGATESYLPKIVTNLIPSEFDDSFFIEYKVYRQTIPHQEVGKPFDPPEGSFIEFDYIYTGKNIDILEMDMKMNWGLTFLNTRISHTAIPSTNEAEQHSSTPTSVPTSTGDPHHADPSIGTEKEPNKSKSPLFLGAKIWPTQFVNKANIAVSTTFEEALRQQAHLENVQAQIKIVGNTQLLNESLTSVDNGEGPKAYQTGLANPFKRPGLVKINISFPSSKELTGVKKFWYDGWFRIFSLENSFEQGVFTQTLNLFSLNVVSAIPDDLATKDSKQLPNPNVKTPSYEVNRAIEATDANKSSRPIRVAFLPDGDGGNGDARRDPSVDLYLKQGVVLINDNPVIENIYDDIVDVWKEYTANGSGLYKNVVPVITSGNDGTHGDPSLHDVYKAIDLRANNLAASRSESIAIGKQIAAALSVRIGNDYDVIYEDFSGYFNNHIHVEYDPKSKKVLSDDGEGVV